FFELLVSVVFRFADVRKGLHSHFAISLRFFEALPLVRTRLGLMGFYKNKMIQSQHPFGVTLARGSKQLLCGCHTFLLVADLHLRNHQLFQRCLFPIAVGILLNKSFVRDRPFGWVALVLRDVTGPICTKWNERESTWRKSGSCQSRGTSQSRS